MRGSNAAYDMGNEAHESGTVERSGVGARESCPFDWSLSATIPCTPRQRAEGPPASLPWCVEHGDCLQAMSTPALWDALEAGQLPPSSRVWREGMECWTPASDVRELSWTLSGQRIYLEEADARSAPATPSVSVALTPAELALVAPLWARGAPPGAPDHDPTSTREDRASMPTLPSASIRREPPPISLDLPASFPSAPRVPFASLAPPPALEATPVEPIPASAPLGALASPPSLAPQIAPTLRPAGMDPAPLSGLRRLARSLVAHRADALCIAAGCAVAILALGTAALTPLPRALAARPGLAAALALAPARLSPAPSPPTVAAGWTSLERHAPAAGTAARPPAPGSTPPSSLVPRIPGAAQLERAEPPRPRERGQVRLRRGRSAPPPRHARP